MTPLGDRHFPIVMIDGIYLGDHLVLIALGIDSGGRNRSRVFGGRGVAHRCQLHKPRNILGHLPDGMHASVKTIPEQAWILHDARLAKARRERLASSLEADHPGAAASVREGLEETLTLQGLGIEGTLYRKL